MDSLSVLRSISLSGAMEPSKWSKRFVQAVTCPVCMEIFKCPRNFPQCSHTICTDCMAELPAHSLVTGPSEMLAQDLASDDAEFTGWIECPVCGVRSDIGPSGISFYPVNSVAQQIVDIIVENPKLRPAARECSHMATTAGLKTECPHCQKNFCEVCRSAHADFMKQDIAVARDRWEKWRPSSESVEATIAEVTRKIDADVALVSEEIQAAISLALDTLKKSLEEQGRRLMLQANMIREQRMQIVLKNLRTNYDAMSGAVRLINDQIDGIGEQTTDLEMIASLHKLVDDTINKSLTQLEAIRIVPRIKLIATPLFAHNIVSLADKLEIGSLKVESQEVVSGPSSTIEEPMTPLPRLTRRPSGPRRSFSYPVGETPQKPTSETPPSSSPGSIVAHVEVTVLENVSFERAGISEPTALAFLTKPSILLVPDGRLWISVIQQPFEHNSWNRISVPDPDFAGNNHIIETNARLATFESRIFMLDVRRRRIVSFELEGPEILKEHVHVLARGATFEGLSINEHRHELYTVKNSNRMLVFDLRSTETSSSPKAQCKVLKRARILGANETFGVVYRLPYHPSDGLAKLYRKEWAIDELPQEEITSTEAMGFSLGLPLKSNCNTVEFDLRGNLLIADSYEETIRIYSKPDEHGKIEWKYCCFLGDSLQLEQPFDPSCIAVVTNHHLLARYGSSDLSDRGDSMYNETICAVIDEASRNIMLLRLPSD